MIRTLTALVLSTVTFLPSAGARSEEATWIADFDQAVEIAKREHKDLFVDFTGSDWCGWCMRLHDEVFSKPAFLEGVKDRFVLVALDFPRGEEAKAKVPNPERNAELRDRYGIQGYPTVLLMTADGEVYGRTGYQPGGAEKYVAHLDELIRGGKEQLGKIRDLLARYEKAQGEEREAVCTEAVALVESLPQGSPLVERLLEPVRAAMAMDPKNEKGLRLRAVTALMSAGRADDDVVAAAIELDPKNEKGLREQVVFLHMQAVASEEDVKRVAAEIVELVDLGPIHDQELALYLYVNAAGWHDRFLKDLETAKRFARLAKEIAPEDNEGLHEMLDTILAKS